MANLDHIIVHCSDSPYGCANLIRGWHKSKGWTDIGYHFVILNGFVWNAKEMIISLDGSVEVGRFLDGDDLIKGNEIGAHALGYNNSSIGICMIGSHPNLKGQMLNYRPLGIEYEVPRGFSSPQFKSLATLVGDLCARHAIPVHHVVGHCETPAGMSKTCPNFDMEVFRTKLLTPFFQNQARA